MLFLGIGRAKEVEEPEFQSIRLRVFCSHLSVRHQSVTACSSLEYPGTLEPNFCGTAQILFLPWRLPLSLRCQPMNPKWPGIRTFFKLEGILEVISFNSLFLQMRELKPSNVDAFPRTTSLWVMEVPQDPHAISIPRAEQMLTGHQ